MNSAVSRLARPGTLFSLLVGLSVVTGLLLTRWYGGYLLFHSLVEIFSIVVAFGIFTVFWNARRFLDNGCFLFLGIAYLFVGTIDLLHTLAYKDMGVFDPGGSNLATQLWVSARYTESLSILAAPLFLRRQVNPYPLLAAYATLVSLLLGSIFYWRVFPACFVGELTGFKLASEYIICLVLIASLILFFSKRRELDPRVYQLLFASILLTIAAEMAFTLYQDVTGLVNMLGHFLKLASFYLIYVAFVQVGLTNPYAVLFRDLKESEESLRRSEARFRGTFDNAAVGIAHVDLHGRFLMVNQTLCEIVGYTKEEMLRKTLLDLAHPDDRAHERRQLESRAQANITSSSTERRYLQRDGTAVWVNLTTAPQRDSSGNPLYIIVVVQDITKRKDAEQQLQAINETLEQRVAERTSLAEQRAAQLSVLASELTLAEQRERRRLAQILHDHLQQLLVATKLKVGILRRRTPDKKHETPLRQVEELLDQTIGASRSLTVELSPPILYDAGLAVALEWLGREIRQKHGLAVEVDADAEAEPHTEDWRVLIFQAVRELLFNVVKHAQAQSARVEMTRTDEQQVQVTVSDTGIGFDPAILETNASADSGFGLFSLRERLGLLGGRVEIDTGPGRGTRVAIFAPRLQPEEPGDRLQPAPLTPPPPESRKEPTQPETYPTPDHAPPIRVLLADDHLLVREGLASVLRAQPDIEVVAEASDGRAAVDLTLQNRPDVVVMDVAMPNLSGIEATRRITATLPDVCVIGLSVHEQADMAKAMRRAGAVAYVAKHGPAEELIAAIRHAARIQTRRHTHSHH